MDEKTQGAGVRRRRRAGSEESARYFMPKKGSSPETPELGQEMATEGDALIQSMKGDQVFYAVTVWRAIAEQNGSNPVIVKEPITGTRSE